MRISLARILLACTLAAACAVRAVAAPTPDPAPALLSVEEILTRNVEARGGLERWRAIRNMVWSGHMEGASAELPLMQFVLSQARPNKMRFDIDAMGDRSVRVFDGFNGWKQKPAHGGKGEVQPFSIQEVRFAQEEPVIDGPLIDSASHGSRVTLDGIESGNGQPMYRLDVQRRSGPHEMVWVDAGTFLESRYDRISYNQGGQPVTVSVYYHDYREFAGIRVPVKIDFGGSPEAPANRMVVERVDVNLELDPRYFTEPNPGRHQQASGIRSGRVAPAQRDTLPSWALGPAGANRSP